ncbi:PspC domain-containing protein [Gordonia sp. CPCC 206044]|uniref:PspC domain-containing protein n=1 Tax=Gordonia sp. CPCC 206044 TaxID=3140793 RepID=UPI003AF3E623
MDTKQIDGMWATRPIRPSAGRTVAGVCAGIGARYRVDPTLVRVAFVVATLFGGSGVLLYIAAWVTMPSEDRNRDHLGSMMHGRPSHHHRHRNPRFILLVVLAIILVTSFGNRTWSSGGLLGAALMLLGWWLLYQRTPEPPPGTSADTRPTAAPASPVVTDSIQPWIPRAMMSDPTQATGSNGPLPGATMAPPFVSPPSATSPIAASAPGTTAPAAAMSPPPADPAFVPADAHRTPPAWDPLGTAQFAWDLPEPTPPPAEPRERRSPLTLVVLGAAVVVAAAGAAAHQLGAEWFTVGRIVAMALAVVGVGLVYAGLRQRRSGAHSTGLVPVALALGVAVVITTAVSGEFNGLPSGGVGERMWKPLSENDIDGDYSLTMGRMVLDLREVDLTADRTVDLRNGIGEIEVQVPDTMNVRADCNAGVGDFTCPVGLSGGTDGTDGPVLTINARTDVGHVEVAR